MTDLDWERLMTALALGGFGGFWGAVARELGRPDRHVSWTLLLDLCAALPIGILGSSVAGWVGLDDPRAQLAVGLACGYAGQAVMTDLSRAILRALAAKIPTPTLPPEPPAQS